MAFSYYSVDHKSMMKATKSDPIRARLKEKIEEIGTNLAKVSLAIGKNHAYLQQFLERGTPRYLPEDVREELARELHMDPDDLRPQKPRAPKGTRIVKAEKQISDGASGTMASVEELDVTVSAGGGATVERAPVVRTWLIPQDLVSIATDAPIERIKIVRVKGDSMSPTYNPVDRLMVDTADVSPSPAGVFIVWDGLGLVVKRVQLVPHSDPPRVKITSDNAKYDPYERILGEAYIQGRVIGKWLWT